MKIKFLWMTASVLALAGCGAAEAQSAPPPPSQGSASTVQEVVVTAERRSTNLQKTAIAASVLTGADLVKKGVASVDQLQTVAPSLTIQNFGQGNDFNIRGIGKGEENSGTTVGVITYRDGVATFPGYFQDEPFYDIANVEVLRGPQGAFAGQNATGGAVFITETNPSLTGGYHGYLQAQYGNYNDTGAQGAINIPISDTLAARFAFNSEYRDSFYKVTGPYTGSPGRLEEGNARFSLLWQPTDALRVLFKTDYNYIDQGGYPADSVFSTEDPFHISSNAHQLAMDVFSRTVLNVSYRFADGITLRSISSMQWGRTGFDGDIDGSALGDATLREAVDERIYSEEVNVLSPDTGPLTWVGGLYYQYDLTSFPVGHFDIGDPAGVYDQTLSGDNPKRTEAVFGQVSYALPAGFQIQVGARYTDFRSTNNGTIAIPEYFVSVPDRQSEEDSKVTGKVALNWNLNSDNFLYAFVATGHKGGGLNTPTSLAPPPTFKPEDVTDYELGWKSTMLDGHLKTQLGGYYNDYKNFQVSIGDPDDPTTSLELNVPSTTKLYGVEAQGQATFGAFSFDFGASLMHSQLGTFYAVDPRLVGYVPTPASCPTGGPGSLGCFNLTGKEAVYAPNFTFNIGGQYVFDLGGDATLTPRINFGHIASQWATLFEDAALGDRLGERNLLSAQVAYAHGTWLVTAYGSNLTDQRYVSAVNSGLRYEGAPRQFGIRVSTTY